MTIRDLYAEAIRRASAIPELRRRRAEAMGMGDEPSASALSTEISGILSGIGDLIKDAKDADAFEASA